MIRRRLGYSEFRMGKAEARTAVNILDAMNTVPRFQPPLFFVSLLVFVGLALYFVAIGFSVVRLAFQLGPAVRAWNESLAMVPRHPTTARGLLFVSLDLALLLPAKRRTVAAARPRSSVPRANVVVALTA